MSGEQRAADSELEGALLSRTAERYRGDAAAATTNDEACPGCGETDGVGWIGGTPTTDLWACTCGLEWAITVEVPALKVTDLIGRTEHHG